MSVWRFSLKQCMKRIIIILCSILAIVVLTYGLLTALSSQNDLRVELTQGEIGVLPLVDQKVMVEIVPGLRFKFDTGSDISTITEADLERLREMGMSVEKKFYPVMGRDGDGKTRI